MISRDDLLAYCLGKPGTEETFPFDNATAVYKVMGKMFALIPTTIQPPNPQTISLKCDPTLAEILRDTYDAVQGGYHLNKKHWNTVTLDGTIPDDEIYEMVDNSYALVVKGLTKADRMKLENID